MDISLALLTAILACVGGYRVLSDPNEPKKLKATHEKIVYHPPNGTVDTVRLDHDLHADFSNAFRPNALKKIHPFIYPKQFNTLDATTSTAFNVTANGQPSKRNQTQYPMKVIREHNDDVYTTIDANGNAAGYADMVPIKTDLPDLPMKHGGSSIYGYDDGGGGSGLYPYGPSYSNHLNWNGLNGLSGLNGANNGNPLSGVKNCLNGILPPVDSLLVLGILGFLIYIISTILNLVSRVNVPLLGSPITGDPASGTMTAATAAAAMSAATKLAKPIAQRQLIDDKFMDTNQNLLRHFERILLMAIELYEGSVRLK